MADAVVRLLVAIETRVRIRPAGSCYRGHRPNGRAAAWVSETRDARCARQRADVHQPSFASGLSMGAVITWTYETLFGRAEHAAAWWFRSPLALELTQIEPPLSSAVSVVGLKVTQIAQGILGRVNRSKQFELCCVSEEGTHALIDHSMRGPSNHYNLLNRQ